MGSYFDFSSPQTLVWFGGQLLCFVIFLMVLKLSIKAKWLTAICSSILASQMLAILLQGFGVGLLAGMKSPGVKWMSFLPAGVCAVILILKFLAWLAGSSSGNAEKDKIVQMIEQEKITAAEGTELLDAMGKTSALRGQDKFSRIDIMTLVGIALVVLGFFCPWVYVGRGMYQAGHHIGALGWTVFIIAVVSAIPIFVTPKDFLYKISMLQIFLVLIGLVLAISVLVRVGENLGIGIVLCLVGFIVEIIASAVKLKKMSA